MLIEKFHGVQTFTSPIVCMYIYIMIIENLLISAISNLVWQSPKQCGGVKLVKIIAVSMEKNLPFDILDFGGHKPPSLLI